MEKNDLKKSKNKEKKRAQIVKINININIKHFIIRCEARSTEYSVLPPVIQLASWRHNAPRSTCYSIYFIKLFLLSFILLPPYSYTQLTPLPVAQWWCRCGRCTWWGPGRRWGRGPPASSQWIWSRQQQAELDR